MFIIQVVNQTNCQLDKMSIVQVVNVQLIIVQVVIRQDDPQSNNEVNYYYEMFCSVHAQINTY